MLKFAALTVAAVLALAAPAGASFLSLPRAKRALSVWATPLGHAGSMYSDPGSAFKGCRLRVQRKGPARVVGVYTCRWEEWQDEAIPGPRGLWFEWVEERELEAVLRRGRLRVFNGDEWVPVLELPQARVHKSMSARGPDFPGRSGTPKFSWRIA